MTDIPRDDDHRPSLIRLSRDLVKASTTMTPDEARFLVDAYYLFQDDRKRAHNQVRAMEEEPHEVIGWIADQSDTMEGWIKRTLDAYSGAHKLGAWPRSVFGIGPVMSAGLLAHISMSWEKCRKCGKKKTTKCKCDKGFDMVRCQTAGAIWRFAGLDPSLKWGKGKKRPFNAGLKVLTWKMGQSFLKFHNNEACVYGHLYKERKLDYADRNERGLYKERAAQILTEKNWKEDTETFAHLKGGKLPPAQIDGMARRYAVKLFLSHLHCVWYWQEFGELPAAPYGIAHKDHTHFIPVPNIDVVEGLTEALRKKGWQ